MEDLFHSEPEATVEVTSVMNDFPVLPHTTALWSIRKAFYSLKRRIPNAVREKQTQLLLEGTGNILLTLIGVGTNSQAFKINQKILWFCCISCGDVIYL